MYCVTQNILSQNFLKSNFAYLTKRKKDQFNPTFENSCIVKFVTNFSTDFFC